VLKNPQTVTGLALMLAVVLLATIGPILAPHQPTEIVGRPFTGPSDGIVLGTDVLGRDVLSRVLSGGQLLILMSVAATAIGLLLGTIIGVTSAYVSGRADFLTMRVLDVVLAFPSIVFALLFVSVFGANPVLLVVLVGVAHTPSVARVMRGAAMTVVTRDYVLWARSIGIAPTTILRAEVFPNIVSPLMVEAGLRLMWSVGTIAALSFLGYGIQPPTPDWGLMASENRNALSLQPLSVVVPIAVIGIFTIGANLFAEGLGRIVARTEGTGA
jgi:peptide/nickel transport system permease protein